MKPGKLYLMVGPSGAGKSTYLKSIGVAPQKIVSSDGIREELCGNFKDQSKNKQVFEAVHALVKARIMSGLDCYVDATNIVQDNRTAIVDLVPRETEITYLVINRSMEEKERDGTWRLGVPGLMQRHENVFQRELDNIMNGDGYPNVKVISI